MIHIRMVRASASGVLVALATVLLSGCCLAPSVPEETKVSTDFGDFNRKTIVFGGSGEASGFSEPAYLRFGPDGRLYVTTYTGTLWAFTLDPNHNVVDTQQYKPFGDRLLTGLAFDKWAPPTSPMLYVVHNAPPIYKAPDFSGKLASINGFGDGPVQELVDGLTRSYENHMTFDAEFGTDRRLYFVQGGNTNNGAPAGEEPFGNRPESELSAALLAGDVRDANFGGIDDLEVYAPGLRNGYGLLSHRNGYLYVVDQGANKGLGDRPDPNGGTIDVEGNLQDELEIILPDKYYGHPNPARDQYAFHTDLADGTPYQEPVTKFVLLSVVTGGVEYTSAANGNKLNGYVIIAGFFDQNIHYVKLSADGMSAAEQGILTGGFVNPLDLAVGPDGAIYVLEAGGSLAFGGVGPSMITVLEPLSPASGTWTAAADMLEPRTGHAQVAVGQTMYVYGGEVSNGLGSPLLSYDPNADAWSTEPNGGGTPKVRSSAAGAGDMLYLFGGYTTDANTPSAETWRFDPSADAWSAQADMPRARSSTAAAVAGGKVYVFGGFVGGSAVTDVAVYDPNANTWEDLSATHSMPTARADFAAVTSPCGLIYCIGGRQAPDGAALATVDAFDPVERRWMTGYTSMSTARADFAAGLVYGKIIVAGGASGPGADAGLASVEEYDPTTNTWRSLSDLPAVRSGSPGSVIDDILYVAGGSSEPGGAGLATALGLSF